MVTDNTLVTLAILTLFSLMHGRVYRCGTIGTIWGCFWLCTSSNYTHTFWGMSTEVRSALLLIHDAVSIMVRRKLRNQENQDYRKPDVMLGVGLTQRILWTNTTLEERGGEGFIFHDGAYQVTEAIIIILLLIASVLGVLVAFTTHTLWKPIHNFDCY